LVRVLTGSSSREYRDVCAATLAHSQTRGNPFPMIGSPAPSSLIKGMRSSAARLEPHGDEAEQEGDVQQFNIDDEAAYPVTGFDRFGL